MEWGNEKMAKVIVQYLVTGIIEDTLDRVEGEINPTLSRMDKAVISNENGEQVMISVENIEVVDTQDLGEEEDGSILF